MPFEDRADSLLLPHGDAQRLKDLLDSWACFGKIGMNKLSIVNHRQYIFFTRIVKHIETVDWYQRLLIEATKQNGHKVVNNYIYFSVKGN